MILSSDLKNIRIHKRLSQRQMADLLHVTWRQYQNYESGSSKFPLSLAELLEFKLVELDKINLEREEALENQKRADQLLLQNGDR